MKRWQNILGGAVAAFAAVLVLGFLMFANYSTRERLGAQPRAEAIVALTGGAQRIKVAGRLLRDRQAKRLLITGVNRIVNRAQLQRLLEVDQDLFSCCVDIDYAAQNTRGNALETRKWVLQHEFDSLIVVTSSYHMPRSLTELGHALPRVELVAHPVVPDRLQRSPWWLDRHNIMLLGSEYLKYLPSAAQFAIGRLTDTPETSGRGPITQRAVAVQ